MSGAIVFVLTPGALLLDYAGPAESLRMAGEMGADLTIAACGPSPSVEVSTGLSLGDLAPLPDHLPDGARVVVVGNAKEERDYARAEAARVVDWLAALPLGRVRVASICSGAILLARAGLLRGRACTTHHNLLGMLRAADPTARVLDDRIFVEDGPVLTSAGVTTGIDLALYLIERDHGAELAMAVARRMVVFARRGPADPQLSPWLAHRNHVHPAVHAVQDAISRDPVRRWSMTELAALAHVSPRHLARLFKRHAGLNVPDYHQGLRLARARLLMADPRRSMEQVAEGAGFASARDLRRVRARHTRAGA
ncbi:MAG: DJ-1/PfpI family protein [Rhodocyclaceae bacterium]|nr:DJ-1/PfpI family protein [Rhodocyclaceae bacterium]